MAKSSRLNALDKGIKEFEKDYKIEVRDKSIKKVPRWQLEIPYLDYLFGGGLAQSRVYELFGQESGGKTALAMLIAARLQKLYDIHVTFIDAEQALDVTFYEKNTGLLTDDEHWFYFQPDYGEQGLAFAHRIMNTGATDLIIIDSVSALTPKAEAEGEIGDAFMGLQARMMGQGLRKITSDIKNHKTSFLFINQIRMKMVMMGNPETTSGGKALSFFASGRYKVRKKDWITEGKDHIVGQEMIVKSQKSKIAPPFREIKMDFRFEEGFAIEKQYVELALKQGFLEKGGAWYTLPTGEKVQGQDKVIKYYNENPQALAELKTKLYEVLFPSAEKATQSEAKKASKKEMEKEVKEATKETEEFYEGADDVDFENASEPESIEADTTEIPEFEGEVVDEEEAIDDLSDIE